MKKGYLLYVRFNRKWTEVYGPFKSMKRAMEHPLPARKLDEQFDMWGLAVPVEDKEKML